MSTPAPVSLADVHVLIPDRFGWTVVPVLDLCVRIEDGETLEEAATNAGIDSGSSAQMDLFHDKVAYLNATGDATRYWNWGLDDD